MRAFPPTVRAAVSAPLFGRRRRAGALPRPGPCRRFPLFPARRTVDRALRRMPTVFGLGWSLLLVVSGCGTPPRTLVADLLRDAADLNLRGEWRAAYAKGREALAAREATAAERCEALLGMAHAALWMGDEADARARLREAKPLLRDLPPGHGGREAYKRERARLQESPAGWNDRAMAAHRGGRWEESFRQGKRAWESHDATATERWEGLYYMTAACARLPGRAADARRYCRLLEATLENLPEGHWGRGRFPELRDRVERLPRE
jgi:hypothetical protein